MSLVATIIGTTERVHIFTHRAGSYLFDGDNREDWIARHFFTGGVMPGHCLIRMKAVGD